MTNIEKALEFFKSITKAKVYSAEIIKHIDLAIPALEKQLPYKPLKSDGGVFCFCSCNRFISKREESHGNITIPYCKWCGQLFDWSDT